MFQRIIYGEKKSLEYATEIGEMLIAAKKQHGEHGKWLAWLKTDCPNIAETTAALYMRIAKKGDELAAAAEANGQRVADLTIRGAARLLAKPKKDSKPRKSKEPSTEAAVDPPEPQSGSANLADLLANAAPDEVVTALIDAKWDTDKVQDLISRLTAKLKAQAQPDQPVPTQSGLRRRLGLSQPSPN